MKPAIQIITNWPNEPEFKETKETYKSSFIKALRRAIPRKQLKHAAYHLNSQERYGIHYWYIELNCQINEKTWLSLRKKLIDSLEYIVDNGLATYASGVRSNKLGTDIIISAIEPL